MIDFLRNCGITDKVINDIKSVNVDTNLYNLNCNQDEVVKIIQCLRDIGVNCISELLVYRIDMFFLSFDKFKKLYIKQDTSNFVKLVNDDYTNIDEI